jgi:hypothetical protein
LQGIKRRELLADRLGDPGRELGGRVDRQVAIQVGGPHPPSKLDGPDIGPGYQADRFRCLISIEAPK